MPESKQLLRVAGVFMKGCRGSFCAARESRWVVCGLPSLRKEQGDVFGLIREEAARVDCNSLFHPQFPRVQLLRSLLLVVPTASPPTR
jgi:hypothetical protein